MSLKADEMWSFTGAKKYPRWLWWAEDAVTGEVVAFVFGRRSHRPFEQLLQVLAGAQIRVERWFTDYPLWNTVTPCFATLYLQAANRKGRGCGPFCWLIILLQPL
ncbi:IS1 family transposase, partial [Arsenicibacter rosenii]|uniref:IS1 family transposase n=1 Tax=Arsenicibacter rosenii TaxID=1750698 RepID=UPI0021CD8477